MKDAGPGVLLRLGPGFPELEQPGGAEWRWILEQVFLPFPRRAGMGQKPWEGKHSSKAQLQDGPSTSKCKLHPFSPPEPELSFPLLSLLSQLPPWLSLPTAIPWVFSWFHPFSHNLPMKGSFSKHFPSLLKPWKCFSSPLLRPAWHGKAAELSGVKSRS